MKTSLLIILFMFAIYAYKKDRSCELYSNLPKDLQERTSEDEIASILEDNDFELDDDELREELDDIYSEDDRYYDY